MQLRIITISFVSIAIGSGIFSLKASAQDFFVEQALQFNKLPDARKRQLCFQEVGVVFIGDGENALAKKVDGSIRTAPSPINPKNLIELIEFQVELLRQALVDTACAETIRAGLNAGLKPPRAVFIALSDGPERGDTKLQVTEYGWQEDSWVALAGAHQDRLGGPFTSYYLNEQSDLTSDLVSNFEVHLPTQSDVIVHAASHKFGSNGAFDKFIYILKAHSGKFLSRPTNYDLLSNMTGTAGEGLPVWRAFMMDPHGPEYLSRDLLTADIYSPSWLPYQGCQALAADPRVTTDFVKEHRSICVCRNHLMAADLPTGVFEACQNLPSLDPFASPFDSFLSSGKSLAYRNYPDLVIDRIDLTAPRSVDVFASAISYDADQSSVRGLHLPRFPTGSEHTLVYLDSCHGESSVRRMFEGNIDYPDAKIVTITSDLPVTINISNYGMLNLTQWTMLSDVPAWLDFILENNEEFSDEDLVLYRMQEDLTKQLEREGLADLKWLVREEARINSNGWEFDFNKYLEFSRQYDYNPNPFRYFSLEVFSATGSE